MLWGCVCMRKNEPVFPTLTDLFRNSLIPISGFFPVTVLILLQTRRLPCFPFTWLQEAVLPGKGAPPLHCTMAAEAAVSHKPGLASSLLTLCVPG